MKLVSSDARSSRRDGSRQGATDKFAHDRSVDPLSTSPQGASQPQRPSLQVTDAAAATSSSASSATGGRAPTLSGMASNPTSSGLQEGSTKAISRFKDLGKKVTKATKDIDSFAKSSMAKLSTTLAGEHIDPSAASNATPSDSRGRSGVSSDAVTEPEMAEDLEPANTANVRDINRSSSSHHHRSPGIRTPQDAFKDLGVKVSLAARSAKHKMDALGPAISSEFHKVKSSIKSPHHEGNSHSHRAHSEKPAVIDTASVDGLGALSAVAIGSPDSSTAHMDGGRVMRTPESATGGLHQRGYGSGEGAHGTSIIISSTITPDVDSDPEESMHAHSSSKQKKSLGKKLKSISHKIIEDGKFIGKNFTKGVAELTDGTIGLHHDSPRHRKSWPHHSDDATGSESHGFLSNAKSKVGSSRAIDAPSRSGGLVLPGPRIETGGRRPGEPLTPVTRLRRVSEVLELDRDEEDEVEIAPYDQETQEYLSRITRLDALFEPTASSSARSHSTGELDGSAIPDFSMTSELSQPVTHINLDTAKDWIKKTMHKPRHQQAVPPGTGGSSSSIKRSTSMNSLASTNSSGNNFAVLPVYDTACLDSDNAV